MAPSEDSSPVEDVISQSEVAVYDRQIRLWGIEAQNKLRHSRVLLFGLCGLGAEVAKNLVLCGLNSLHIIDPKNTTKEDIFSNYFLNEASVGKERGLSSMAGIQELNPLVKIECTSNFDEIDLSHFSLVILVDQPYSVVKEVNEKCRARNVRFIAASVYGWTGYAFFDFNNHSFLVKEAKPVECVGVEAPVEVTNVTTLVDEEELFNMTKQSYPSFESTMNVDWHTKKLIRKAKALLPSSYFIVRAAMRLEERGERVNSGEEERDVERLQRAWEEELKRANQAEDSQSIHRDKLEYMLGAQLSSACAIVGGMIGQESIKALTEAKFPLRNLFLYSALDTSSRMCDFPPK